jgi:cystathionine beta-lyase
MTPPVFAFDDVSLAELRTRRSAKWRRYPPDVLPAWVAEMDFALAPAVRHALAEALARDDTGYPDAGALPETFARFALDRWGWEVNPGSTLIVGDIMTGVGELLAATTRPGDRVVVNPPVYPPFFVAVREAGRELVEVPLTLEGRLDLDGLEAAFAAGVRAYVLCNPHNPTGTVFARSELETVARLAARHDVLVISDEVHAPMTLPGAAHTPFLALGGDAAEQGFALVSASKAWNVAGLKCALVVTGSQRMNDELRRVPDHVRFHVGHFGVLAGIAAFADGVTWLDALVAHLDLQRRRLGDLLALELPGVRYVPPQAGYLAWLDFRELGLGDDPSALFLDRGRVALSPGPTFGSPGNGFARLNIGTSGALLEEAVRRIATCVR